VLRGRLRITFYADPDPSFHFDADPAPYQRDVNLLASITSKASFLSPTPPFVSVHGLSCEPLRLLNLCFDANPDPDPAFQSDSDQDLASQNNADPCRAGSATLVEFPLQTFVYTQALKL
jgi:hypothetical protein